MKRLFALFMALLMLAGCSSTAKTETKKEDTVITAEDVIGAFIRIELSPENCAKFLEWKEDVQGTEGSGPVITYRVLKLKDGVYGSGKTEDRINVKVLLEGTTTVINPDADEKTARYPVYEEQEHYFEPMLDAYRNAKDDPAYYGRTTRIMKKLVDGENEQSMEITRLSITGITGAVYTVYIPDKWWNDTTRDSGEYTVRQLGRHITFTDNYGSTFLIYENGYVDDGSENAPRESEFTDSVYELMYDAGILF